MSMSIAKPMPELAVAFVCGTAVAFDYYLYFSKVSREDCQEFILNLLGTHSSRHIDRTTLCAFIIHDAYKNPYYSLSMGLIATISATFLIYKVAKAVHLASSQQEDMSHISDIKEYHRAKLIYHTYERLGATMERVFSATPPLENDRD